MHAYACWDISSRLLNPCMQMTGEVQYVSALLVLFVVALSSLETEPRCFQQMPVQASCGLMYMGVHVCMHCSRRNMHAYTHSECCIYMQRRA